MNEHPWGPPTKPRPTAVNQLECQLAIRRRWSRALYRIVIEERMFASNFMRYNVRLLEEIRQKNEKIAALEATMRMWIRDNPALVEDLAETNALDSPIPAN